MSIWEVQQQRPGSSCHLCGLPSREVPEPWQDCLQRLSCNVSYLTTLPTLSLPLPHHALSISLPRAILLLSVAEPDKPCFVVGNVVIRFMV